MSLRILLDACIGKLAADVLRAAGHDVAHLAEMLPDPGDDAVLDRACTEDRVLLTLDRDFGELAIVRGAPHRGIVRLTGLRASQQGRAATMALETYADELGLGAIVTVEPGRVRVRPGAPPRDR